MLLSELEWTYFVTYIWLVNCFRFAREAGVCVNFQRCQGVRCRPTRTATVTELHEVSMFGYDLVAKGCIVVITYS